MIPMSNTIMSKEILIKTNKSRTNIIIMPTQIRMKVNKDIITRIQIVLIYIIINIVKIYLGVIKNILIFIMEMV